MTGTPRHCGNREKVATYHQFYAMNRAVESALRAADMRSQALSLAEKPEAYGLPSNSITTSFGPPKTVNC